MVTLEVVNKDAEVVSKDAEVSTYHMAKIFCCYLALVMLIEYLDAHKARIKVKRIKYLYVHKACIKTAKFDDQNSVKQWIEKDLISFVAPI